MLRSTIQKDLDNPTGHKSQLHAEASLKIVFFFIIIIIERNDSSRYFRIYIYERI